MLRALAGGAGAALVAGPLGCFVVWRRLAYFGETMAHAGLLGIALSFALDTDVGLGVVAAALVAGAVIVVLERLPGFASDTLLGILANTALALGVIVVSLFETTRIDVASFLFGDVFAVSVRDLYWVGGGGALCLGILVAQWRSMLVMTIDSDMAAVEGVAVSRLRPLLVFLIAVLIAIAMKIVGLLMIVSLLIIPAAAARRLATSPEAMAIAAALLGVVAVASGMGGAIAWDLPGGPAIVVAAGAIFAGAALLGPLVRDLMQRCGGA